MSKVLHDTKYLSRDFFDLCKHIAKHQTLLDCVIQSHVRMRNFIKPSLGQIFLGAFTVTFTSHCHCHCLDVYCAEAEWTIASEAD